MIIIIVIIVIVAVVIIFIWIFQYMCPVTTDKKSSNVMNIIYILGHTKFIIRLTDAATLICRFEKKKKFRLPFYFYFFSGDKK